MSVHWSFIAMYSLSSSGSIASRHKRKFIPIMNINHEIMRYNYDLAVLIGFQGLASHWADSLPISPLASWRLRPASRARSDWLKPLKQVLNPTKTTPISKPRSGLVTLFATWQKGLTVFNLPVHVLTTLQTYKKNFECNSQGQKVSSTSFLLETCRWLLDASRL